MVEGLLNKAATQFVNFNTMELSNMLWALGKLRVQASAEWMNEVGAWELPVRWYGGGMVVFGWGLQSE